MTPTHPNHDCPDCGEPGLVNTSTNFAREWSCNWCGAVYQGKEIDRITG